MGEERSKELAKALAILSEAADELMEYVRTGNRVGQARIFAEVDVKLGAMGLYTLARCMADAWVQWSGAEVMILDLIVAEGGDPAGALRNVTILGITSDGVPEALEDTGMMSEQIAAARFALAHLRGENDLTRDLFFASDPGYPLVIAALAHMCSDLRAEEPWKPTRWRMS